MNTTLLKEMVIENQYHGQRVDVVLAKLFPEFSRSQLTHWLKMGAITLDQRPFKPKEKVLGGEHVKLSVELQTTSLENLAEDLPLPIVYEDEALLVVNKAAGVVVHPGAGNQHHTLVNALLFHDPSLQHLPRAGIVHRLDKDTTGLLVVAKTLTAHTNLIRQMQARTIERHYWALVYGHVVGGGTIDTAFSRHPHNRLKMAVSAHGKQAITHYVLKKRYSHFTLLDIQLKTGRTHQIRVHMAHIHHPIVGDPLYGGRARYPAGISEEVKFALEHFSRQALHAHTLSFDHPLSGKALTLTAPIPEDFQTLLTTLDTHLE